jgi:hypothetical protein
MYVSIVRYMGEEEALPVRETRPSLFALMSVRRGTSRVVRWHVVGGGDE